MHCTAHMYWIILIGHGHVQASPRSVEIWTSANPFEHWTNDMGSENVDSSYQSSFVIYYLPSIPSPKDACFRNLQFDELG